MVEALLTLIGFCLVFGIAAALEEATREEKPESISDAQTTSERGLW